MKKITKVSMGEVHEQSSDKVKRNLDIPRLDEHDILHLHISFC